MATSLQTVTVCVLLLTSMGTANAVDLSDVLWGVAGGAAAVVGAPFVLTGLGFGAGGIAVGSLAAKAMSVAWTAGHGIAAVGTLQAAGAAGLTVAQSVVVGTAAGVATIAAKKSATKDTGAPAREAYDEGKPCRSTQQGLG